TCSRCASSSSTGWCRDSNPIPANRAPCICALSSTGSPCTHCTARIQTEPSVHYGPTCDTLRSRKRSPTTSPYERAGNGHERVHVVGPEHPGRARREVSAQRRHHDQPEHGRCEHCEAERHGAAAGAYRALRAQAVAYQGCCERGDPVAELGHAFTFGV